MYKEKEYIVVGLGIAGITACIQLLKANKSFVVIAQKENRATKTAGGVINPVVLKRFTLAWKSSQFLNEAITFYKELEQMLAIDFFHETPVYKSFHTIEEQNDWTVASDKKELEPYLSSSFYKNPYQTIAAPFALGKVSQSYWLDIALLIEVFENYLSEKGYLLEEDFNHTKITPQKGYLQYKHIQAKHIVFCEGALAINNPWFPQNILIPKKGEYITIHSPELRLDAIVKSKFFIIPLGNHLYKIGATFVHGDTSLAVTQKGKEQLLDFIEKTIYTPYTITQEETGLRPTIKDRRPVLGSLPTYKNYYFFNGLGTRGLLMAPLLSRWLLEHIEKGSIIPEELHISRFIL